MNEALTRILADREARWHRRVSLATAYNLPVGTLTLNIPGSDKNPVGSQQAFTTLLWQWREMLRAADIPVLHSESRVGADGPCLHLVVRSDALSLKRCAVALEERGVLGRLADADVVDSAGQPVGRAELLLPPRRCLLCEQEVALCMREGRHNAEEVRARVLEILHLTAVPA